MVASGGADLVIVESSTIPTLRRIGTCVSLPLLSSSLPLLFVNIPTTDRHIKPPQIDKPKR